MELSVIIPVYNSEKTVRECVSSILNSDFDRDFEVVVVDDGSTDRSIEKIKNLNVRIVRQENKGAAAARNTGARHTRSNLLVFVDSDVTFFKDTLRRIYGHLAKDDVDYVSVRYSKRPLNQGCIHRYKALADYSYYYDFAYTKEQKRGLIRQTNISGGTEGYKKRIFDELGGFDEKVKGANIEREKLIAKLAQGNNMIADGKIRTNHYYPGFRKITKEYFKRTFHSMDLAVNKNYYSQPYMRQNSFRVALGALSAIMLTLSSALFLIFGYIWPFGLTLAVFLSYLSAHLNMFITAYREYGFLFTLYTLTMNLFFCLLISAAGFLGLVKTLLKR